MANDWRLAKSLETLREQINRLSPNRDKRADGTKGDAAHASRSSDHNPWVRDGKMGVVTALDITDDEAHGVDNMAVAETLRLSRDARIKYIIADGHIANKRSVRKGGKTYQGWEWSPYTGKNAHTHHVHISVEPEKALYDDASDFDLSRMSVTKKQAGKPVNRHALPVLSKGAKGHDVEVLQVLLNDAGAKPELAIDADFGERTEKAVKAFQKANGIKVDGIVGMYTWEKLLQV